MYSTEAHTGARFLAIARHAVEAQLGLESGPAPTLDDQRLGASFVTLTRNGELRGCIGTLEPYRSLAADIAANACHAAFDDRRFPPISRNDWPSVQVEVSVLGDIEWCDCPTLAEAIEWVQQGSDGVVIVSGNRRATFLPQVWESLPDPIEFFDHLLQKAGLWCWPADTRVGRYPVGKYHENAEGGMQ